MSPTEPLSTQHSALITSLFGVELAHDDIAGERHQASPEALLAVLRALGAPIERMEDLPGALRQRRQALWQQGAEPIAVAWEGRPSALKTRRPAVDADRPIECRLSLETGETRTWRVEAAQLGQREDIEVEGVRFVTGRLPLPDDLPCGYHRLRLDSGYLAVETLVIAAPRRAWTPEGGRQNERSWGVFLPLYGLRSESDWGAGDLTDLEALLAWVGDLGGRLVGTLPLLAAFLETPFCPSPYAPVSRLFWNEFYLDLTRVPELERCPDARELLESNAFQEQIGMLRGAPMVDYRRLAAIKRSVLSALARCFFSQPSQRLEAFDRFRLEHPRLEDYARFRAAAERRGEPWRVWPEPLRNGVLAAGDFDEAAKRYHLYAQCLAHEQMTRLAERARSTGAQLYLDLPMGVHPDGYDVWRERSSFGLGASVGAPPDRFFSLGQNWGFPPPHPETIRQDGYSYFIAGLRHHLAHAGMLRLDHVMGLHRLFWIPAGMDGRDGVYVRYRADEMYAILALESHRHQAVIVGEDLGTVPDEVRAGMSEHNLQRMYVLQFEARADLHQALPPVPPNMVASLNTHDTATFAGFWGGLDVEDRKGLGLLDDSEAVQEQSDRETLREALVRFLKGQGLLDEPVTAEAAHRACLAYVAASPARVVLVNLEDLWLEERPQNVPGTVEERPNWQRKALYQLTELCTKPEVADTLRYIHRLRSP